MKENSGRADGLCMKGTAMSKKAWEIELNTMKNSVPVILKEEDPVLKASYIALLRLTRRVLEKSIDMLGFSAPEKM